MMLNKPLTGTLFSGIIFTAQKESGGHAPPLSAT
jgi:hypothetical protein